MMNPKQVTERSKKLSYLLRHKPEDAGLTLDAAGWVGVDTLLAALKWSREDLNQVVADNNKKRFEFDSEGLRIRASQGHSVNVDLGYTPTDPPAVLYHGTSQDAAASIRTTGIQKRDRHHVHLSADNDTAVVVARRRSGPSVIFKINAAQMHADGHKFYVSTNGVWLVDEVPKQYLL